MLLPHRVEGADEGVHQSEGWTGRDGDAAARRQVALERLVSKEGMGWEKGRESIS